MDRSSRHSQRSAYMSAASSGEYHDEHSSPETHTAPIYTQYRDRDSLDLPPRGYNHAIAADAHHEVDDRGYSDPFASRTGEMDDEVFNVEDDFNNVGPRYGEVYGADKEEKDTPVAARPRSSIRSKSLYSLNGPAKSPSAVAPSEYGYSYRSAGKGYGRSAGEGEVELVTVPALGQEWSKDEIHAMSRRGQSDLKAESRARNWTAWRRDQKGTCGIWWLTRRMLVFMLFGFIVALALTLIFVIPRAPSFNFPSNDVFGVDNSTIVFSRTPTNFTFQADFHVLADASSSFLPVRVTSLVTTVYDLNTNKAIATGDLKNFILPHKSDQAVTLPVTFSYTAVNASDTTWNDIYDACGHLWPGTTRPDLQFNVELQMKVLGLIGTTTTKRALIDITCPFELSAKGV